MKPRWTSIAVCMTVSLSLSALAFGQTARAVRPSGAETGLVGVKLYDPGTKLISMFGSPLEIQPVTFGGSSVGPVGGGGGTSSAGASPSNVGGGGVGAAGAVVDENRPFGPSGFDFANSLLQGGKGLGPEDQGGGPSRPAPPSGGTGGGGGGGGTVGGTGANADRILFTRWIYERGTSKYGFILDKGNRVVQIEAIGMSDARVRTRRGVGFGATFGELVKRYGAPEGYEISGNTLVVRFLRTSKVAFRLNRLGKDKPHRVTGIVVAGGKA